MRKKHVFVGTVLLVFAMLLTGCVPGDGSYDVEHPAGFFWGIWHGWIEPVSLILGFLNNEYRIYEVFNSGWWYDLGYYIAIISGFGGLSLFRRKKD